MLKWILILVAVLIAIPLAVTAIGAFLPRSHVAGSRARFRQPPEALWATLTDFARWPEWNSAFRTMERAPDREGKPVWVGNGKFGTMPSILETFQPPRTLVTRIPEDAKLGFSGTWTYEIALTEGGATLSITERGEVSNPLFRFMSTFVFDQRSTAREFLRALGKRFGESVEPEDLP